MVDVWFQAVTIEFRHKTRCLQLAKELAAVEKAQQGTSGAVAARGLQLLFGIVVDQLMRSATEYVQPSLFQRVLVQQYLRGGPPSNDSAADMLNRALDGVSEEQTASVRAMWGEMEQWFAVHPSEIKLMQSVVDLGQK